jgi:hypothetical protein
MKRIIANILLAVVLAGSGFHCKKTTDNNIWTGKLVTGLCAFYVVQLQSGPISDSSILTKSWFDSLTNTSYTNVFEVSDLCTFGAADVKVGDVFAFTLNGPTPVQNCYIPLCLPDLPVPATKNSVTNIKVAASH